MGDSSNYASEYGGAGNALGSFIGYEDTAANRAAAQQDYENANSNYNDINPDITADDAGPSALGSISLDPKDRGSQLAALSQLENIYKSGGMDDATKAQLSSVNQTENQNAQALNNNVKNQMEQRGLGASGASFGAQEANDQATANRESQAGVQALGQAQGTKMQALQGAATIGAGLQGQDFGEAAQKASAADAISKFNATQGQTAQQETVNNELGKAGGQAGTLDNMAGNQMQQGQMQMNADAGLGQGIGSALGGGIDSVGSVLGGFL